MGILSIQELTDKVTKIITKNNDWSPVLRYLYNVKDDKELKNAVKKARKIGNKLLKKEGYIYNRSTRKWGKDDTL